MGHGRASALPIGDVAYIAEICASIVEIVRQRDVMQIVERPTGIDDGASAPVKEYGHCEPVSERHADGCRTRSSGILFVDLLYGNQEVLTAVLNLGRR